MYQHCCRFMRIINENIPAGFPIARGFLGAGEGGTGDGEGRGACGFGAAKSKRRELTRREEVGRAYVLA